MALGDVYTGSKDAFLTLNVGDLVKRETDHILAQGVRLPANSGAVPPLGSEVRAMPGL